MHHGNDRPTHPPATLSPPTPNRRAMSPPTRKNAPRLGAGPRYGPTHVVPDGGTDRPAPAQATHEETNPWPPTEPPGDRPKAQPPTTPGAPTGPARALATLPEVLTAREAAAILRVGRNQLYQAVARGQLPAVRIGRTIRIPKHALLDLLDPASPPAANGDE